MKPWLAMLLVFSVSITTLVLVWYFPDWARTHTTQMSLVLCALGVYALAAVPDGRLTPWFALLGGRLFLGRVRGLWLSAAFTLVLTLLSGLWAYRLVDANLITTGEYFGFIGYFVLLLAPWEEIWWRGVWFAACSRLYWTQVLLGSALFALGHAHRADWTVAVLFLQGVAFASLRRAGAPLILLIPLHGMANVMVRLSNLAPEDDVLLINASTIFIGVLSLVAIGAGFTRDQHEKPVKREGDAPVQA